MGYERLHQDIVHLRWEDCEATLATADGKEMAREIFKSDYPLHMACERRAPEKIILELLGAYPDACMKSGKKGNLPLHIASQQGLSLSTILELLKVYPEALDELNSNQCTPRDFHHRNEKVREVLTRPTACWVESVEREEYYERKRERIDELQQRVSSLKVALEESKRRRHDMTKILRAVEPMVEEQKNHMDRAEMQKKELMRIKGETISQLTALKDKAIHLQNESDRVSAKGETVKRSNRKKTHVVSVTEEYDKVVGSIEELRQDVARVKVKIRLQQAKQMSQLKAETRLAADIANVSAEHP